jgi:hypothetical protein
MVTRFHLNCTANAVPLKALNAGETAVIGSSQRWWLALFYAAVSANPAALCNKKGAQSCSLHQFGF